MYEWDFSLLWTYRWLFAKGLGFTLLFTVATSLLGLLIGLVVAFLRLTRWRFATVPVILYIGLFRCTPVLVQLVWFYYALPGITGITLSPSAASVLALALYGGAFFAEIIRGGIVSIEPGQWDGARALGMRRHEVMSRVILPQAITRMIPAFANQGVLQLKNTSLVSVVAVPDLLYQSQVITAETYRPLEVYTTVAVIYLLVLFPLTLLVHWLEISLARGK
jgi:polar amino acid transport system permease protein